MTKHKITKASDVYHETEHSFASKASFEKTNPQIEQFSIEIVETEGIEHVDFKAFDKIKHRHIYTKETLPGEFINCRNPDCREGGLSFSGIIRKMIADKLTKFHGTEICRGYESLSEGLKEKKNCRHQFHFKVKMKYAENLKTA
jgi:hypothetical protein